MISRYGYGYLENTLGISSFLKYFLVMMMIIGPNSRAHKGEKKRGEVKGEYGRI